MKKERRFENCIYGHAGVCGGEPEMPGRRRLQRGRCRHHAGQTDGPSSGRTASQSRETVCRGTRPACLATGQTERRSLCGRTPLPACRPANRGGFPHVARSGVEHASHGHIQPARVVVAAIPWSRPPSTGPSSTAKRKRASPRSSSNMKSTPARSSNKCASRLRIPTMWAWCTTN